MRLALYKLWLSMPTIKTILNTPRSAKLLSSASRLAAKQVCCLNYAKVKGDTDGRCLACKQVLIMVIGGGADNDSLV